MEHPHVKAIFGFKKLSPVKIGPKMAIFRKFKGLHINCSHRDPQKAHPWPELRLLKYFRKDLLRGVGCSKLQELPKKC